MKVGILLEELFDEREFIYPYYRVQEAGLTPLVIGTESRAYKAKSGWMARASVAAHEVDAGALAGLVIPGGYAPDRLRRSFDVLELVRAIDRANKPLAAICHAGWVLISAGVVRGRRLTGYFSIKDDLTNAGAEYVDEPLVVSGNLITSRGPDELPLWARAFVDAVLQNTQP
ncbi:MAG TPA: type 1 glutamine amidotransferase [Oceanithermus profundus]|uniref:Type 1 glutamine amidotransferase n=1 Tax=Oceanithermus profundus TaxID=187137 RepID=A0A7C4ZRY5_9DEIN|nr:type 1 glutamine amidotransferase [Oceanithermus profundus]